MHGHKPRHKPKESCWGTTYPLPCMNTTAKNTTMSPQVHTFDIFFRPVKAAHRGQRLIFC